MTDRKSLKSIVRARMERTGESYSTSLRQVRRRAAPTPSEAPSAGAPSAGAPAAVMPSAVVLRYAAFGPERHHPSALVRHLLGQVDIAVSEPMACGLGGGVGFLYAVFEYAAVTHPLLTIVAQHHPAPWVPEVLERLRVPFTEAHSTSTAAAMTKLRRALAEGRAVLCTVDRSGLPWHGDAPPMAYADPYPVVVAGILAGADGDTVYLDDVGHAPHPLDADRFAAAWSAHRKGRHHMLFLSPPPATGAVDLPAAVRDAIATTVAHLTGPVLGNSFDVNVGFSGMAKLASELRDRRRRTGWARRFAGAEAFEHAMRRLDACLQREHTAPDATRPIFADYLDEAAALLADPALSTAAGLFRDSGAGWSALATAARRARVAGRPDEAGLHRLYDGLADLVESVLELERRAVDLLAVIR